jgi:predicted ATPase/SAM-dependent methyltransferase
MITEITFPRELAEPVGLKQARLHGLKPIVVLAGPNGAGKSRYLKLVGVIVNELGRLLKSKKQLEQSMGSGDSSQARAAAQSLNIMERNLAELIAHAALVRSLHDSELMPRAIWLSYSLKRGYGDDPLEVPPAALARVVDANKTGGFENALLSVQAYFYEVARALHEAENLLVREHPAAQMHLEDAHAFNKVLRALLSAEIEPSLNDKLQVVAHFRGRPFNPKELSNGEIILAVWAIVLHRQKEDLRGAYLLVDEPENHLHPDVCIRALTALQEQILGPDGQIWLATHSVPLIAHAGIESVHFVDNGTIEYAGNKIGKVLDRLLGGQDGRAKLRALMADADEIAFDNFAAQCLLPPGVATAQEDDPQQLQMVEAAKILGANKENVRILDFAAGRGRLAAALRDAGLTANRRFSYYAFQDPRFPNSDDQSECIKHIQSLGQPGEPETYLVNTLEGFTVPDAELMDLVVMCNVLHEIPVGDWQRAFERIHDVLADGGHLVIFEDQTPSIGELPHADGYVILNEPALQHLFGSKNAVMPLPSERGERLTAFAVPRAFLKKVKPETIGKALGSVKRMAGERIRIIRDKRRDERSFQEGRLHAHYALLYANAHLASQQFPEPEERSAPPRTK